MMKKLIIEEQINAGEYYVTQGIDGNLHLVERVTVKPQMQAVPQADTGKVACFLGLRARDLYGYDKKPYEPLMQYLKDLIAELHKDGYTEFISDGSQGFGQLVFWAVENLKRIGLPLRNIVYVPFKEHYTIWHYYGTFGQKEYGLMMKLADEVRTMCYSSHKCATRVLNREMVKRADLLVTLDNVSKLRPQGMMTEATLYADTLNKQVMRLAYNKDAEESFAGLDVVR